MARRRTTRPDGGASLVEFALLAPLLFALLLGMITGGLALSARNSMQNAVREGARLGATVQASSSWSTAVTARVAKLAGGDLQVGDICAELIYRSTAGEERIEPSTSCTLPSQPSTADVPVGHCAVKVWARTDRDLNFLFATTSLSLSGASVNRYERACAAPTP